MLLFLVLATATATGLESEFEQSAARLRFGLPANSAVAFWCMYIPAECSDSFVDSGSGNLTARVKQFAIARSYALDSDTCGHYRGPGADGHVGRAMVVNQQWADERLLFSAGHGEIVTATDVLHLAAANNAETALCPCLAGSECVGAGVYAPKICVPMQPTDLRSKQAVALMVVVAAGAAALYVLTDSS